MHNRNKDRKHRETEYIETETTSPQPDLISKATLRARLFSSLTNRDFRYLWLGSLLSNVGTWIQTVAVGYLVYKLTGSEFLLGFINFASTLPAFFLAPVGGVFADRYDRRYLLLISQFFLMVLALLLGIMVSRDYAPITAIAIISLISGIASSISFPAWLALIPDVVPDRDLTNAIALNSAQFNVARLMGPAIAGFMISALNISSSFYLNAISYLAVLLALFVVYPDTAANTSRDEGAWLNFIESLRYAKQNRAISVLLFSISIISIFGISHAILMPAFATSILHVGAKGLGYLMAASGLGATIGALLVAGLAHLFRRRTLIIGGMMSLAALMMVFAFSKSMIVSVPAQIGIGASIISSTSIINTSLQTIAPAYIRGRIMSLFVWAFLGMAPLGSIFMGAVANSFGNPVAVASGSIILFAAALIVMILGESLKSLKQ
jgi:MFS family permease